MHGGGDTAARDAKLRGRSEAAACTRHARSSLVRRLAIARRKLIFFVCKVFFCDKRTSQAEEVWLSEKKREKSPRPSFGAGQGGGIEYQVADLQKKSKVCKEANFLDASNASQVGEGDKRCKGRRKKGRRLGEPGPRAVSSSRAEGAERTKWWSLRAMATTAGGRA